MHKKSPQSLWLDPSDTSTLFQDSAGTVAAANKLRVSRVDDRSGKGNHATQSTEADAPYLVDEIVLWFDSGDSLSVSFAEALGSDCTVISAVPGTGVDVQTGLTIGAGAYSISAGTAGLMIFDRALTASETSLVTRYLEMKLAILEFVEFDFSALPLDPRITFTRASTGTYFDANGVMQTAAINQPRIDHDPVTGEVRGLLVEELRTNSLLNSATLATQSVTVTAATRTLSFYGTGTVTLSGASTAGPLVGTGGNDRVSLTFAPAAGTLTLTVSGTVEKAQLEAGSFTTSYIPTEGAAMTRAADVAVVNDLSSIRFNQGAGGFLVELNQPFPEATRSRSQAVLISDSGLNRFAIRCIERTAGGITIAPCFVLGDGVSLQTLVGEAVSPSKVSAAYSLSDGAFSSDGSYPITSDNGYVHLAENDKIRLGSSGVSTGHLNGYIRRLRYYPRRLSNAELQELTA